MLDVCLPGTGGVIPLENRWLACCWLEYQGSALLIDCGEGTQIALKKSGCRLSRLDTLLITHFHADHIAGLPGLLLTLGNSGKTTPLTIVGPAGLGQVVGSLMIIAPILPYPLRIGELEPEKEGAFELAGLQISCLPLSHAIPCFGYGVTVQRKPVFNPRKAEQLGVPKPLYRTLHAGQTVRLKDGREIEPPMVLDGERKPLFVCYCTDTQPVAAIADFARGADLLICEGMYGDDGLHEKMEERGHMVFSDSAGLAKQAGVKQLWLTHFSPACLNPEGSLDAARRIFPNTQATYDGIRLTLP